MGQVEVTLLHGAMPASTDIPARLPPEISEAILSSPNVFIERIVSQRQASPEGFWYDRDQHVIRDQLADWIENAAELAETLPLK